jgi:hypothetical protein
MKVPAIIATGVICLALGLGIGILGMHYYGPIELPTWLGGQPKQPIALEDLDPNDVPVMAQKKWGGKDGGGPKGGGPKGGGPKGGGGRGGGPKGGMMGKGPSAKIQLNTLITKLDLLTQKPLTVKLDAEQKKQVAENLKGLDTLDELTDEDAKKRLDGLLEAVKDHKETLQAAGFRWPDSGPAGLPLDMTKNPFRMEPNSKHLQALEERVGAATR